MILLFPFLRILHALLIFCKVLWGTDFQYFEIYHEVQTISKIKLLYVKQGSKQIYEAHLHLADSEQRKQEIDGIVPSVK